MAAFDNSVPYLNPKQALLGSLGQDPSNQTTNMGLHAPPTELPFTPSASGPPADTSAAQMPQGIDPALAAIYQKAGQTPGGRGTGFADWQYWQGVGPSQYSRLASDIAGTGPDQTTGTPWSAGAWQGSGRGGGGISGPALGAIGPNLSGGLANLLQGSATNNISQALNNLGGVAMQGSPYLQSLIAQLGGG